MALVFSATCPLSCIVAELRSHDGDPFVKGPQGDSAPRRWSDSSVWLFIRSISGRLSDANQAEVNDEAKRRL